MILTRPISQYEIQYFLKDVEKTSKIELLEGKEKDDLKAVAKTKGVDIDDMDLALFKTVYAFTDKANANGAILPQKELLKILPTIRNKPVNINHQRRYVVGHYIDYSYITNENKIIAYGVFYKSNFGDEWEEAQKLFKAKKLSTSFEIWSEREKRKYKSDGSYELNDMLIAGGALIFEDKDNKPAFKDAKVLRLAKALIEKHGIKNKFGYHLEYSHIKDKDLIVASQETITQEPLKIKCSNCGNEYIPSFVDKVKEFNKCPNCKALLDNNGQMLYAPQNIDFSLLCPNCKVNSWLIKSTEENNSRIQCLSCKTEYDIEYARKSDKFKAKMFYVYEGKVECPQCNYTNQFSSVSSFQDKELKCERCGLEFKHDIRKTMKKKIKSISEIVIKTEEIQKSSEGGNQDMFKLELSKFHRYIDIEKDVDLEKEMWLEDYDNEIEMSERLKYQERKDLSDSDFAVVVKVKNKKTGEMRKIRKYPINDEAHVKNALARLGQDTPKTELKRMGISLDSVLKKVYQKAKKLGTTALLVRNEDDLKRLELPVPKVKAMEEVEKSETELKALVKEAVKKIILAKKELKKTSQKLEESKKTSKETQEKLEKANTDLDEVTKKVEFYKSNAKEVLNRRETLGKFAEGLSDESLLNNDKFEKAKLLKENTELKLENSSNNLGDPDDLEESADELQKWNKDVDKLAFGE